MKVHEKIRTMRESRQLTQEDMANWLNLSVNGYAKIERGETRLSVPRLEQIAEIFETDVVELIQPETGNWSYHMGDNNRDISFYVTSAHDLATEVEKLRLTLRHKDELLAKQNEELQTLKEVIMLLKQNMK